jgi:hypothetical protein
VDIELSHRACDPWGEEDRGHHRRHGAREHEELPPEVPAWKAKLLVMVEE